MSMHLPTIRQDFDTNILLGKINTTLKIYDVTKVIGIIPGSNFSQLAVEHFHSIRLELSGLLWESGHYQISCKEESQAFNTTDRFLVAERPWLSGICKASLPDPDADIKGTYVSVYHCVQYCKNIGSKVQTNP